MPVVPARWCSFLLLGALLLGCRSDPKDPQFWLKELQGAKRPQDRVRLLEDLRKSEYLSQAFLPMLHEQLAAQKGPETRAALARILGQLKDPSSVEPLVEAVDTSASGSAADRMNRDIAQALGALRDPKAVPVLLKLLNARDPFLQLQAAESLGDIGAPAAVGPLLALAQDESKEALVVNRAIEALGKIGDPTTVPALIQLMFEQRGPTSLYDTSMFALYRLGKPSADALLSVLSGNNDRLKRWAREHEVAEAALYSKSAQVLGYLLEPRAENLLVQRLGFQAEDPAQQAYVRLTSADSLGRLRSKAAVKPLTGMLNEPELMVHSAYLRALGRIGSKEAAPALLSAASQGMWELRAPALDALGLLGDGKDAAALETLKGAEAARVKAECAESSDSTRCKNQEVLTKRRSEVYAQRLAQLKAADKCGEKAACWVEALEDAQPGVRTRAALTLGRSGNAEHLNALFKHLAESDQEARLAVLQAADWLTESHAEGLRLGRAALPALEKQLHDDEGKSDWVEASDNLKRLIAKLNRKP
jgi:HEAT repeat protein